jgi:hypothetical protein
VDDRLVVGLLITERKVGTSQSELAVNDGVG